MSKTIDSNTCGIKKQTTGGKMSKNSKKEDLPVGKMIVGLVMLIFSPIIISLVVAIVWSISAMLSTRW
ncbi:hypothetical protein [Enterococcus plantarum]|uniref:hypothetical protein n=1 Tax=Enterococcus TaxID=1350 RepID=UPI001A8EA3A1|nr:hypothetical protein [Enterococcus plantarum]MBO0423289.1 hypothetical protein [Enterococcus plantarum]